MGMSRMEGIGKTLSAGLGRLRKFDAERFLVPSHPPVRWLLLSLLVLIADQFSKLLVLYYLQPYQHVDLSPVLHITLLFNKGAAFSLLAGANGWQQWLFVVLALVFSGAILVWLRRLPAKGQAWLAAGLALILGGALGNAVDRVWHAHVIDFIQLPWFYYWPGHPFPTFNIADSAITVGAIIAAVDALFHRHPKTDEEATEREPSQNHDRQA